MPISNYCVEQLVQTIRFNSRYNFNTIHHCFTEHRDKSHYGPVCESRKQRAQSVVKCDLTDP